MKLRYLFVAALVVFSTVACKSKTKANGEAAQTQTEEIVAATTIDAEPVAVNDGSGWKPSYIVISKETMTLKLYDVDNKVIYNFPVAVGKNYGNKKEPGDMRTPEGEFTIHQINDAKDWPHDFGDGKGLIQHAYGDWFIRLKTPPHTGIGIHGTHDPQSIGTRATEGCIRLRNENLNQLRPLVSVGMKVIIETSQQDRAADAASGYVSPTTTAPVSETKKAEPFPGVSTTSATSSGDIIIHTIESGDLFSTLAVKYNTTSSKIQELNPGVEPTKIQIGQKIRIQPNTDSKSMSSTPAPAQPAATPAPAQPAATPAPAPAQPAAAPAQTSQSAEGTSSEVEYHTVVAGESFYTLAKKYGTTQTKLLELNPGVEPTKIQIGQRVRVK